ncbi:hypothetical protein BC629DRAFT_1517230 [Irpex lacteus]|nr:hypothetical protein BC629DRAFT_1517230 [Irpex lacteus]
MDNGNGLPIKKQEDGEGGDVKAKDTKPVVRTLNRVPRACNACRKQKMRCEGAENPPCRRCRHAGLECLFEKPQREASLTGEAGLERIRSLEAHVADIRQTQTAIQSTLMEIAAHLRGSQHFPARSPSVYPPPFAHPSPTVHSMSSPSGSTPTAGNHPTPLMHRDSISSTAYQSPPLNAAGHRPMGSAEIHAPSAHYSQQSSGPSGSHGTTLPPFSSIESMGPPRTQPSNVSSVRYHLPESGRSRSGPEPTSGSKRAFPSSTATSADSTDAEEDDGELPASGLVAPWEVLRGLADVAIERAALENGGESEAPSRARTASPEPRHVRPAKRRKTQHKQTVPSILPDVVTKNIIPEAEARELFRIFYHGCSTFLSVFDANVDTYDALHERSPFAVNCICMVAARVRDGGSEPSDTYLKCQEEVQSISCATLFSPVVRQEAVQAMSKHSSFSSYLPCYNVCVVLVSGWSDNGWLSGGHAVRMAMEICMYVLSFMRILLIHAWPEILRRMKANKAGTSPKERQLIISARTWLCLYLFEHQMSYGTGRPAILKDDESISQCRLLLQHPLAIEDDMRLVSTVELMAIRERIHNSLAPLFDRPVDERTFMVLRDADADFRQWYATWDQAFSQKYEDAAFYRQSLQIQHLTAELFHNATALRGIDGPEDVQKMPTAQRELAIRSIQIGRQILDITVNSPAYREGMKYGTSYFLSSRKVILISYSPDQCDPHDIRVLVERLAALLSEVPGRRYALTLQLMLKRFKRRKTGSISRSPQVARPGQSMREGSAHSQDLGIGHHISTNPISPTYDSHYTAHPESMGHVAAGPAHQYYGQYAANIDNIWRGFESTSTEQLPVWLSDQTLGGASFSQNGIDAFLLPNDYLPPAPQIW